MKVLFVCTGNTCRSPMAEAIARRFLEEKEWDGVDVSSAGVSAMHDQPASRGAVSAVARRGLDLTPHRSSQLSAEKVEEADLILAMTPSHIPAVHELGGAGKVSLLGDFAAGPDGEGTGPRAVPDPFGGDDRAYDETYEILKHLVEKALARLEPLGRP